MAVTLFVVRATITKDKEAAFNKWYNEEHAPQLLQYNGAASARRYRKILGDDKSNTWPSTSSRVKMSFAGSRSPTTSRR